MSLTDISGCARQFLYVGTAFIDAYWSIYVQGTYNFAKALYNGLLRDLPADKAGQQARDMIKSAGDTTWLAYTVYTHLPFSNCTREHPLSLILNAHVEFGRPG